MGIVGLLFILVVPGAIPILLGGAAVYFWANHKPRTDSSEEEHLLDAQEVQGSNPCPSTKEKQC